MDFLFVMDSYPTTTTTTTTTTICTAYFS